MSTLHGNSKPVLIIMSHNQPLLFGVIEYQRSFKFYKNCKKMLPKGNNLIMAGLKTLSFLAVERNKNSEAYMIAQVKQIRSLIFYGSLFTRNSNLDVNVPCIDN